MSEQTMLITYEGILELFRQTDLQMDRWLRKSRQETDQKFQETSLRLSHLF